MPAAGVSPIQIAQQNLNTTMLQYTGGCVSAISNHFGPVGFLFFANKVGVIPEVPVLKASSSIGPPNYLSLQIDLEVQEAANDASC